LVGYLSGGCGGRIEKRPSGYPVAIERGSDSVIHRIFPLTPFIAVRVFPDRKADLSNVDFAFTNFRYRATKLSRSKVRSINRPLVQCAEDVVFHLRDDQWIPAFVEKYAGFRIDAVSFERLKRAPLKHGIG
jgi:hypothetical protein